MVSSWSGWTITFYPEIITEEIPPSLPLPSEQSQVLSLSPPFLSAYSSSSTAYSSSSTALWKYLIFFFGYEIYKKCKCLVCKFVNAMMYCVKVSWKKLRKSCPWWGRGWALERKQDQLSVNATLKNQDSLKI